MNLTYNLVAGRAVRQHLMPAANSFIRFTRQGLQGLIGTTRERSCPRRRPNKWGAPRSGDTTRRAGFIPGDEQRSGGRTFPVQLHSEAGHDPKPRNKQN
jgi:hypothetical protein